MANQLKSRASEIHFKPFTSPRFNSLSLSYHTLHSGHAKRGRRKEEKKPEMRKSINFFVPVSHFCLLLLPSYRSIFSSSNWIHLFHVGRLIAVWIRSERRRRNEWRRFCVQFQLSIYKSIKGLLSFLLSLSTVSLKIQ